MRTVKWRAPILALVVVFFAQLAEARLPTLPGRPTPKPQPTQVAATPTPAPQGTPDDAASQVCEREILPREDAEAGTCEFEFPCQQQPDGTLWCWVKLWLVTDGEPIELTELKSGNVPSETRSEIERLIRDGFLRVEIIATTISLLDGAERYIGEIWGNGELSCKNPRYVTVLDPRVCGLDCKTTYKFNVRLVPGPALLELSCSGDEADCAQANFLALLNSFGCHSIQGLIATVTTGPCATPTPGPSKTPVPTRTPHETPPPTATPKPTKTPTVTNSPPPVTPTPKPTPTPTPSLGPTSSPGPTQSPPPPTPVPPGECCNHDAQIDRGGGITRFKGTTYLWGLDPGTFDPKRGTVSLTLFDEKNNVIFDQSVAGQLFSHGNGNRWSYDGSAGPGIPGIEQLQFYQKEGKTFAEFSVRDSGLDALFVGSTTERQLTFVISVPGNGAGDYVAVSNARRSSEGNRWNVPFPPCPTR